MTLVQVATCEAKRLAKDDSGFVLAFTMSVFLFLMLLGFSVYAVGETVRQRIELQNFADAAAYSAAAVQADSLSRVATLNRVMSWCYIQTTRRQMDYIVHKWLKNALDRYQEDADMVRDNNLRFSDPPRNIRLIDYNVTSNGLLLCMGVNGSPVNVDTIFRAISNWYNMNHNDVEEKIYQGKRAIYELNLAEDDLIRAMPSRLDNVVKESIAQNIAANNQNASDFYHCLLQANPAFGYFRILGASDEEQFLSFADDAKGSKAKDVFGAGYSTWFPLQGNALQRSYRQQGNVLKATWDWFWDIWRNTPDGPVWVSSWKGSNSITAGSVWDDNFVGQLAQPQVLTKAFFGEDGSAVGENGSLVVGLARTLRNPFDFDASGSSTAQGLFSAFNLDSSKMWTVSAARAGYKGYNGGNGEYVDSWGKPSDWPSNPAIWEWSWNLRQSDWDAQLISIAKAAGTSHSAGDVLNAVATQMAISGNSSYKINLSSTNTDTQSTAPELSTLISDSQQLKIGTTATGAFVPKQASDQTMH